MKIAYLGMGAWGFALASLLANNGHKVVGWSIFEDLVNRVNNGDEHPALKGCKAPKGLLLTTKLEEALACADLVVESVTSAGIRDVFSQVKRIGCPNCPLVLTSKGIEQDTGLILSDVLVEVLGEKHRASIGSLSGPSFAVDVVKGLPTSVVASGYTLEVMETIQSAFSSDTFRVYTNPDIKGVSFGGALKNIIAIACGIAEGLKFGMSARAALMTRGLSEMTRLAEASGCKRETLYGLSGFGDLALTASSTTSRNFRFGMLLAEGLGVEAAKKTIGMAVEGAYTVKSALQLSEKLGVEMPITEAIYGIIFEGKECREEAKGLMRRPLKEEM